MARPLRHAGTPYFGHLSSCLHSPACVSPAALAGQLHTLQGRIPVTCCLHSLLNVPLPLCLAPVQVVGAVGWNKERLSIPADIPQGMQDLIAACFGEPQGRPSFRCAAGVPECSCLDPQSVQHALASRRGGSC